MFFHIILFANDNCIILDIVEKEEENRRQDDKTNKIKIINLTLPSHIYI